MALGEIESRKFDVVVVGAGIVGLACAYHILKQDRACRVAIVEKAPAAGQGDTSKSVAGVRNTFTSEVNRLLSETSIDFYKHVQEDLSFDLGLDFVGYLWLLTRQLMERFEPVINYMRKQGVALRVLELSQLSDMISRSRFAIDDSDEEAKITGLTSIAAGLQGLKCGTIAPEKLVNFYENEICKMGGAFHYGERVRSLIVDSLHKLRVSGEPLIWQDAKIAGVVTDHREILADQTVIAAGSWSTQLLDPIGVDSHVRTKKRQVFTLRSPNLGTLMHSKGFNDLDVLPLTIITPRLVYLKPNWRDESFWVGVSDHLGRPFTFEEDPRAEDAFYTHNIYPLVSYYFPDFKNVRPFSKWAGQYDMNTIDANPYVCENLGLAVVVGTSGSGLMKADSIGRIVAAAHAKQDIAVLYGGRHFKVARLGVETRQVEPEEFVI